MRLQRSLLVPRPRLSSPFLSSRTVTWEETPPVQSGKAPGRILLPGYSQTILFTIYLDIHIDLILKLASAFLTNVNMKFGKFLKLSSSKMTCLMFCFILSPSTLFHHLFFTLPPISRIKHVCRKAAVALGQGKPALFGHAGSILSPRRHPDDFADFTDGRGSDSPMSPSGLGKGSHFNLQRYLQLMMV